MLKQFWGMVKYLYGCKYRKRTNFRELIFRGDKFSWVRAAHRTYYCYFFVRTNFHGFNFRGEACPRKLIPNENFCAYGIKAMARMLCKCSIFLSVTLFYARRSMYGTRRPCLLF